MKDVSNKAPTRQCIPWSVLQVLLVPHGVVSVLKGGVDGDCINLLDNRDFEELGQPTAYCTLVLLLNTLHTTHNARLIFPIRQKEKEVETRESRTKFKFPTKSTEASRKR